ncbi:hypothetical protein [Caldalkalibacillus mannanilyticus]|nr:hypothetical protein [Caldalkalibacillus mannanilyticus]
MIHLTMPPFWQDWFPIYPVFADPMLPDPSLLNNLLYLVAAA